MTVDATMSREERLAELRRISSRIGAVFDEWDESHDDEHAADAAAAAGVAPDPATELKAGISLMAGDLRRKGLLRVALLQSAHAQLSRADRHETFGAADDDDDDDEGGGGREGLAALREASSGAAAAGVVAQVVRAAMPAKRRLEAVHAQEVQLLREMATEAVRERALTLRPNPPRR